MTTNELLCGVCGGARIDIVPTFSELPRVSSDCRPFPVGGRLGVCPRCGTIQKPTDPTWVADAQTIYGRYDMFRQAAQRAEQAVFDQTVVMPVRRSAFILAEFNKVRPFFSSGRALDVGCGNGPTLRALAEIAPEWDLYGHEISDANLPALQTIPRFKYLYTGDVKDIDGYFDLVVLSQSLEHVPDPVSTLMTLRDKLSANGMLLVQVPNARLNVFDLVVADHRSHFDPATLCEAARRAGFKYVAVSEWVFKELSMTASNSAIGFPSIPMPKKMPLNSLRLRVEWLSSVVTTARNLAQSSTPFGIFGTSIAGTWLFGAIGDSVRFFVDEDTSRIGRTHEGRPIFSPDQVPDGSVVYIPLIPEMASKIAARLSLKGIDVRIPPHVDFGS